MIYWVAVALAAAAVTIWLWLRRGNGASAAASTAVKKKAVFPNGWTMYCRFSSSLPLSRPSLAPGSHPLPPSSPPAGASISTVATLTPTPSVEQDTSRHRSLTLALTLPNVHRSPKRASLARLILAHSLRRVFPPPPPSLPRAPTALQHFTAPTVFNKGEADYLYEEIIEEDTYALLAEDSFVGALPEAPVVFDVGANMGMFSVAVLKRYPQARLFAFEPIPALHAICSKNVQLHSSACGSAVTGTGVGSIGSSGGKDENVGDSAAATTQARCYRMGLSDKRGSANFDFYPHFSLWTHTHDGAAMGDARQTRLQQDVPAMIRDAQGTGKLPAWTRACPSSLLVCLGRRLVRFLGGGRINLQCGLGVMADIIRNEGVKRVDLLKVGGGGRVWLYTCVWGGGGEGTMIYIYVREGVRRGGRSGDLGIQVYDWTWMTDEVVVVCRDVA